MQEKKYYSKKEYGFLSLITIAYLMLCLISGVGNDGGYTFYALMLITLALGIHTVKVHIWPYFK